MRRWQCRPYPHRPSSRAGNAVPAQIRKLAELHDSGILTDEEFAVEKAEVLADVRMPRERFTSDPASPGRLAPTCQRRPAQGSA